MLSILKQNYRVRLIVAGSRDYKDRDQFDRLIATKCQEIIKSGRIKSPSEILFISGAAPSGADRMLIDYCKDRSLNYKEYPADWYDLSVSNCVVRKNKKGRDYNVLAGHNRNQLMANDATDLFAIWDGFSTGTLDMCERAEEKGLKVDVFNYVENTSWRNYE